MYSGYFKIFGNESELNSIASTDDLFTSKCINVNSSSIIITNSEQNSQKGASTSPEGNNYSYLASLDEKDKNLGDQKQNSKFNVQIPPQDLALMDYFPFQKFKTLEYMVKIEDRYDIISIVNDKSQVSSTVRAIHRFTHLNACIKIYPKVNFSGPTVQDCKQMYYLLTMIEMDCFNHQDHLNQCYEILHDQENIYIVSEIAYGSDLKKYMLKRNDKMEGPITELGVKQIALQLLNAVQLLHSKRIVHNEIQLDKILIHKINVKQNRFYVKLNQSRHSRKLSFKNPVDDECFREKSAEDLWNLTLSLYILLSGETMIEKMRKVKCKLDVNRLIIQRLAYVQNVSELAKNFILFGLTVSIQQVYDCTNFLAHPWFHQQRVNPPQIKNKYASNYIEMTYMVRMGVNISNRQLWQFIDHLFEIKALKDSRFQTRAEMELEFNGLFQYRKCTIQRLMQNYLRNMNSIEFESLIQQIQQSGKTHMNGSDDE